MVLHNLRTSQELHQRPWCPLLAFVLVAASMADGCGGEAPLADADAARLASCRGAGGAACSAAGCSSLLPPLAGSSTSFMQAAKTTSQGSPAAVEGPLPGEAPQHVAASGAQQPNSGSTPKGLLQLCQLALHTSVATLAGQLPELDLYFTISFLMVALLMSAAAFALVVFPETLYLNRVSHAIAEGCTPSEQPFPGLQYAIGRPQQPQEVAFEELLDSALTFCPELVVPPDCFCTLVIPIRPLSLGPFDVTSLDGNVMLRVLPHAEVPELLHGGGLPREESLACGTAPTVRRLFTLVSAQGRTLGHGGMTGHGGAHGAQGPRPRQLLLLDAVGEPFAELSFGKARSQYVLWTSHGARLCFWGSSDYNAISVCDDVGKRVAKARMCKCEADPTGDYCCLRSEPLADVALVLCGLLCINHIGQSSL